MPAENDVPLMAPAAEQPVPRSLFSVDAIPPRERYEIWHDSIACIFEVGANRATRGAGFAATVDAHMFGPVMLARTETVAQTWVRSAAVAARDGMDHYMIQLFEAGHMVGEHRDGTTDVPTGGLIVFDLAEPVTTRTDAFCNLSLILPRRMIEGVLRHPGGQHMRMLTDREPMVALLRDHMLSLKRAADRMTAGQAEEVAPATAALAAACLNGSLEDLPLGDGRPTLRDAVTMERCRRFVELNLSAPDLGPETVARAVGTSRTELYRLFEPHGGVAHYIRDRRLRSALLALADRRTRGRPIYDIALAVGFPSDASFSRAFRERFGVTPRDVRNGAAARTENRATTGYAVDRRYEDWLNRLAV